MTKSFSDMVVVVSGCGRGQGLEYVRHFASRGASIGGFDLFSEEAGVFQYPMTHQCDLATLVSWAQKMDRRSVFDAVDMTKLSDLDAFASKIRKAFGNLDLLICNAGVQYIGEITDASEAMIDAIISTNVAGTIKTVKALSPLFRPDRGGSIVLIGSASSIRCPTGQALYAASKGALEAMTRGLAIELGTRNIRVNAILPSYVLSEKPSALSSVFELDNTTFYESYPLAGTRGVTAQDLCGAVEFLGGQHAARVTGTCMVLDGGKTSMA